MFRAWGIDTGSDVVVLQSALCHDHFGYIFDRAKLVGGPHLASTYTVWPFVPDCSLFHILST